MRCSKIIYSSKTLKPLQIEWNSGGPWKMVGHQITNLLASHMPHLAKTFPWKGKWWREWKTSYIDHGDDALTQQRRKWKCSDTQQFRSRKRKNDLCGKWEHGPDPVITNHAFGSCPCKLNSEGVAQVSLEMGGWRDEPSSWAELFWDNPNTVDSTTPVTIFKNAQPPWVEILPYDTCTSLH